MILIPLKDGHPSLLTFVTFLDSLVKGLHTSARPIEILICLSDINTRSGLKKVHAKFDQISQKLDYAYSEAQKVGNDKVVECICGVWAKMCHDAILRNRLFQQG